MRTRISYRFLLAKKDRISMNQNQHSASANLLGIGVAPLDMELALVRIRGEMSASRKGYICFIGVHGIMEAQRDPLLTQLYAKAAMVVPDGMPTVWVGRWQGYSKMQRVTGPDLMLEVIGRPEFAGCRHYFYGGKPGVAEELQDALMARFPGVQIVGTYTPPFRDLTSEEEDALVAELQVLKPDCFWVGISTPKQERFMTSFLPRVENMLMFGVGAAFDFHTGRIKDAPQWLKRAGLQWLHRLAQDPRRLFWRYVRNNSAFLWHISLQLTGLRSYPPVRVDGCLPVRPQTVDR